MIATGRRWEFVRILTQGRSVAEQRGQVPESTVTDALTAVIRGATEAVVGASAASELDVLIVLLRRGQKGPWALRYRDLRAPNRPWCDGGSLKFTPGGREVFDLVRSLPTEAVNAIRPLWSEDPLYRARMDLMVSAQKGGSRA